MNLSVQILICFVTYFNLLDIQVYFESDEIQAAIVTCGGLCPGLNTVIRELVCSLHHMYGVTRVLGIEVHIIDLYGINLLSQFFIGLH